MIFVLLWMNGGTVDTWKHLIHESMQLKYCKLSTLGVNKRVMFH